MGLPVGKNNSTLTYERFSTHMNRNVRMSSQKERMLRKLEERKMIKEN